MGNFTVYRSSAGSGKTFTLVLEYLTLVLTEDDPSRFKNILAITFTNKASAEMRERIISTLEAICGEEEKAAKLPMVDRLKAATGADFRTLRNRAKKVLTHLLHHYSDLSVSTIDKFTSRIIKTFSNDLGIGGNYAIELDQEMLIHEAVDNVIARVNGEGDLSKALIDFTENETLEERNINIEQGLYEFSKILFRENDHRFVHQLRSLSISEFFAVSKGLAARRKKFEEEIRTLASSGLQVFEQNGVDHGLLNQGSKGIKTFFQKVSAGDMEKMESPGKIVAQILETGQLAKTGLKQHDLALVEAIKPAVFMAFHNLESFYKKGRDLYFIDAAILKQMPALTVLHEIEAELEILKKDQNKIALADFNRKIYEVILDQPAPFLYERLGEKYRNYLIDEFQDTSVVQWQNLLPLIDNGLSEGNFSMLVGDGKQAIYRWRNGEVEQFLKLPEIFEHQDNPVLLEKEDSLKRNYKARNLGENFRSRKEIVDFNNELYDFLSDRWLTGDFKNIYSGHTQTPKPDFGGGGVQIELFRKDPNLETNEANEKLSESICQRTLEIIRQVMDEGYSPSDIAVIVRNNPQGNIIANYLTENTIPILSRDSLMIGNSLEVQLLLSFMQMLAAPGENLPLSVFVSHLLQRNQNDDRIPGILLLLRTGASHKDILEHVGITVDTDEWKRKPVLEIAELACGLFGFDQKANLFVEFFLEKVHAFSEKRSGHLGNFLEWWKEYGSGQSVVMPEGNDAVSVMTIHKSKGLQFPVVIFPFSSWWINRREKLWIPLDPEEFFGLPCAYLADNDTLLSGRFGEPFRHERMKAVLDNVNLYYVATTRPEDRLYMLMENYGDARYSGSFIESFLNQYREGDDQKSIFTWGKMDHHPKEETKKESGETLLRNHHSNWRSRIRVAQSNHFAEDSKWEEKRIAGELLHRIMASAQDTAGGLEMIDKWANSGQIDAGMKELLIARCEKLFAIPELAAMLNESGEHLAEQEIVDENGNTYRPDRIILKEDKLILIDLKTGREKDFHREQISNYAELLNKMGYSQIQTYLVYLESGGVVRIS